MSILLSVIGTVVFIVAWLVGLNIYDPPQECCYACRWAVLLWLLTLDALIFAAAVWLCPI